jgi:hypothetical protein
MHATYGFLVSLDELRHNLPEDAKPKDLLEAAVGEMELWADKQCDENNWFRDLALVTATGEVISSLEDMEGGTFLGDVIHEKKGREIFDVAYRFALGCVANDLELYDVCPINVGQEDKNRDKVDELGTDALIAEIQKQIPARLSKMYADFQPVVVKDGERGEFDREGYKREKITRAFEWFVNSLNNGAPGFSDQGTPYEFRNFDIRGDRRGCPMTDDQELAILFMDIHT